MDEQDQHSAAQVIESLARQASRPEIFTGKVDDVEFKILTGRTADGQIEAVSIKRHIDEYRKQPEIKRGLATVNTLQSFMDLVNRHKIEGQTTIFGNVDPDDPSLVAVIDYHPADNSRPSFGGHRVMYPFPLSDEFRAWKNGNNSPMKQREFGAFIEDNISSITQPTSDEVHEYGAMFHTAFASPGEMISLSRSLSITVNAEIKDAHRIESGETEIIFAEQHRGIGGAELKVPGLFMIALPIFDGGNQVRIVGRLRYRLVENRVQWIYSLYRWREAVAAAIRMDLQRAAMATNAPSYEGQPEDRY